MCNLLRRTGCTLPQEIRQCRGNVTIWSSMQKTKIKSKVKVMSAYEPEVLPYHIVVSLALWLFIFRLRIWDTTSRSEKATLQLCALSLFFISHFYRFKCDIYMLTVPKSSNVQKCCYKNLTSFKLDPTSPNIMQQVATGWANVCNTLRANGAKLSTQFLTALLATRAVVNWRFRPLA